MSFKRFDPEDLVVSAESITQAAWEGSAPTLTSFHTSSAQVAIAKEAKADSEATKVA